MSAIGKDDEAGECLKQCLNIRLKHAKYHTYMGHTYHRLGASLYMKGSLHASM
jgi:hypothetical protein